MGTSLSNLVANLTEGISKIRCKDYDFYLNMKVSKISLIKYKYLSWNKNYSNKIHEELKRDWRTHSSLLMMISINLFCYREKNLIKHHCMKKKNFITTK